MLDEVRFPTLAAYLAELPAGLASYPTCRTKGAIPRSVLDEGDFSGVVDALPPPIAALVRERPSITSWVPAVHSDAVFHVYCDVHARTDRAMLDWTYERTARVKKMSAYRHLLEVAGPRMLLRTGERLHAFFQQGTELSIPELEAHRAVLVLEHPARLHSRLNQLSNVALIRALVDLTGGQDVTCAMVEHGPTRARYAATWR